MHVVTGESMLLAIAANVTVHVVTGESMLLAIATNVTVHVVIGESIFILKLNVQLRMVLGL